MGMILAKRRTVAALAATAIVASGAMWAPAAHAAPTCVDVPGSTLGSTVKVGPVEQRIPAVSGIKLCAEGPGALPFRTDAAGGGLTVYVGGGTATVGTVTVSWLEDGAPRSETFNPGGVPLPGEECLLSVGIPAAPVPTCFIAIGVDDPTGLVQPVVDEAERQVENARVITCQTIPDWYDPARGGYVSFCNDPVAWSVAVANEGGAITCSAIPPMYDDWGTPHYFCSDAAGWTNALIDEAYDTCNGTLGYQVDPNTWQPVYFCDDPVRWTQIQLENLCRNLCDNDTLRELIARIGVIIRDGIKIQIG